jgi:hypothetical protein
MVLGDSIGATDDARLSFATDEDAKFLLPEVT